MELLRYSKAIIVLTFILALISAYSASNVKFERGLKTYLSKDSEVYVNYKLYTKNYGVYEKAYLFLKSDNVLSREVLNYMLLLEKELKRIDGVGEVLSPAKIIYKSLGCFPDDVSVAKEVAKRSGLLISDNLALISITITTDDEAKLEEIAKQIERVVEFTKPPGLNVQMTGGAFLWYQIKKEMGRSLGITMSTSIILMILILFTTFRTVVSRSSFVFIPLLISVLAVLFTFGLMPPLGIPMTELTHGALPILIGLSIDYAVQIQNRYEEEKAKGRDVKSALEIAMRRTGLAIFLALITSVLCFSSMSFCGVPGLGYFGFILSVGLTMAFILSLTLLPALMYTFDKGYVKRGKRVLELFLSKLIEFSISNRKYIIVFIVLIAVSGFYSSMHIGMEIQHRKYAPQDLPAVVLFNELERILGGQSTFIVVLNDREIGNLKDFEKYIELKGYRCEVRGDLLLISKRLEDYEDYKRSYDEIENSLRFFGFSNFYITGKPVLDMETGRLMIEGQMRITTISYFLIVILLLLIYKSIKKAVIPLLPITTVICLMNSLMFLLGIKHTMMSITLNSIIIGLGIDYSIHVVERFYEERKRFDTIESIRRTVERTGRAVTISALTTAFGFFSLMFSKFPIAKSAGFLSFLAIILCFVSALTVVPAFLIIVEKFKASRNIFS